GGARRRWTARRSGTPGRHRGGDRASSRRRRVRRAMPNERTLAGARVQLGPCRRACVQRVRAGDRAVTPTETSSLMRIGIDARELSGRATGAGRYLGGLLREWAAPDHAARPHEFVLYAAEPLAVSLASRRFATRTISG